MSWLLAILGMLVGGFGCIAYAGATTVMHQIVGSCIGIAGTVLFVGGAIVAAIERIPESQTIHNVKLARATREREARLAAEAEAKKPVTQA